MSPSPISKLRALSLENSMPPRARFAGGNRAPYRQLARAEESTDDSRSETTSSSGGEDEGQDGKQVVRGQSGLYYKLDGLSKEEMALVRDSHRTSASMTPTRCRQIDEETIGVEFTETRPLTVRVKASGSTTCSKCSSNNNDKPCEHIIAFYDQLTKATHYSAHENGKERPLTMTSKGYPKEYGDPFKGMASFDLSLVGNSLHCDVEGKEEYPGGVNPNRAQDVREMLGAAQLSTQQRETVSMRDHVDHYRPDIFDHPRAGKKKIKRGDLECTLTRMLCDNDAYFHYFKAQMKPTDPINDTFRKLSQRVLDVLDLFKKYGEVCRADSAFAVQAHDATGSEREERVAAIGGASTRHDVPWAATHLLGVVRTIRNELMSRERIQWTTSERQSAAWSLVRILTQASNCNWETHPAPTGRDRNLCIRLVGERPEGEPDSYFVIDLLAIVPDAIDKELFDILVGIRKSLKDIMDDDYRRRFDDLLPRLERQPSVASSSSNPGSKRPAQEGGRGPKRMK